MFKKSLSPRGKSFFGRQSHKTVNHNHKVTATYSAENNTKKNNLINQSVTCLKTYGSRYKRIFKYLSAVLAGCTCDMMGATQTKFFSLPVNCDWRVPWDTPKDTALPPNQVAGSTPYNTGSSHIMLHSEEDWSTSSQNCQVF